MQAVAQIDSLGLGYPFFGPQKNALGLEVLDQEPGEKIEPDSGRPGGDLHAQPLGVAIDDQAAQAVGFAEDQATCPLGRVVAQLLAKLDRPLQPPLPKRLVQGLGRHPGVEPHANPAGAVKDAAGDEFAVVGHQVDDVAIGRLAFDVIDRAVEHPGMPAIKRPGLADFQDRPGLGEAGCVLDVGNCFRGDVHSTHRSGSGAATHRVARDKVAKSANKETARVPVMRACEQTAVIRRQPGVALPRGPGSGLPSSARPSARAKVLVGAAGTH